MQGLPFFFPLRNVDIEIKANMVEAPGWDFCECRED